MDARGSPKVERLALVVSVLPNLIWVLLDRTPWISDTSFNGTLACQLHDAMRAGAREWGLSLLSVPLKPPLLPWLGEFFVPLGRLFGYVDSGLLLLPVAASLVALLLLHRSLQLLGYAAPARCAGCFTLAASPLFVEITSKLYTQPLQLAATCWLMLVMIRARAWEPERTALHVLAAGSTAMLTTLSSPVFCLVPALVAAATALRVLRARPPGGRPSAANLLPLAVATLAIVGLTVAWYARNHRSALGYATWAYRWIHAGLLGSAAEADPFLAKLGVWLALLMRALVLRPGLAAGLVMLAAAAWASRRFGNAAERPARFSFRLIALHLAVILLVFSSSLSQDYNYVLPVIPFVGLALAEGLSRVGKGWLTGLVLGALASQWTTLHLAHLGLIEIDSGVQPLRREPDPRFGLMERIVGLGREVPSETILLATGTLSLHNMDLDYYASKNSPRPVPRAAYESVEFLLLGSPSTGEPSRSVDDVWQRVVALQPAYVVLLERRARGDERRSERWTSTGTWRDVLLHALDVSDRISSSELFVRVPLPDHPGIELYRWRDLPPERQAASLRVPLP